MIRRMTRPAISRLRVAGLCVPLLLSACTPEKPVTSQASQQAAQVLVEQTGFVPPPRSLSDVVARLEAEIRRRDVAAAKRAAIVAEEEGEPVAARAVVIGGLDPHCDPKQYGAAALCPQGLPPHMHTRPSPERSMPSIDDQRRAL